MGRAIVREPRAFLMDEPLSNLDAKLRVQTRAEIARLQTDLGVTTIYVTHDQTEAMTMGDRVAVLKKGELQQVDAPQVLYDRPEKLFVAGFIGSPAMNLVEADLVRADGALFVQFADVRLRVDDEVLQQRPALERYEGRRVIAGIRPEDMEDAGIGGDASDDHRLSTTVSLRESLGSEVLVHVHVAGLDSSTAITTARAEASDDREVVSAPGTLVAKLPAHSAAEPGAPVTLHVDPRSVHCFDPAGPSLRGAGS